MLKHPSFGLSGEHEPNLYDLCVLCGERIVLLGRLKSVQGKHGLSSHPHPDQQDDSLRQFA